jgi:hypothetical protein
VVMTVTTEPSPPPLEPHQPMRLTPTASPMPMLQQLSNARQPALSERPADAYSVGKLPRQWLLPRRLGVLPAATGHKVGRVSCCHQIATNRDRSCPNLRIMQWNLLADGLAQHGDFVHVRVLGIMASRGVRCVTAGQPNSCRHQPTVYLKQKRKWGRRRILACWNGGIACRSSCKKWLRQTQMCSASKS